ncbi:hypothetical protein DFH06DRAFT_1150074 [Mycena polygramma]|nr:hypothetical protein DFH06DRAFT_1150074 [Mycena polygramma]
MYSTKKQLPSLQPFVDEVEPLSAVASTIDLPLGNTAARYAPGAASLQEETHAEVKQLQKQKKNTARREKRLKNKNAELKKEVEEAQKQLDEATAHGEAQVRAVLKKRTEDARGWQRRLAEAESQLYDTEFRTARSKEELKKKISDLSQLRGVLRLARRQNNRRTDASKRATKGSRSVKHLVRMQAKQGRAYKVELRAIARVLVSSGCKEGKVGDLMQDIARIWCRSGPCHWGPHQIFCCQSFTDWSLSTHRRMENGEAHHLSLIHPENEPKKQPSYKIGPNPESNGCTTELFEIDTRSGGVRTASGLVPHSVSFNLNKILRAQTFRWENTVPLPMRCELEAEIPVWRCPDKEAGRGETEVQIQLVPVPVDQRRSMVWAIYCAKIIEKLQGFGSQLATALRILGDISIAGLHLAFGLHPAVVGLHLSSHQHSRISKMFSSWLAWRQADQLQPATPARQNICWEHIAVTNARISSGARTGPECFLSTEYCELEASITVDGTTIWDWDGKRGGDTYISHKRDRDAKLLGYSGVEFLILNKHRTGCET